MAEEWRVATLAEKIPPQAVKHGTDTIGRILTAKATGLSVISDYRLNHQWLQVRAKGEDTEAFLNLLTQEQGNAAIARANLERWDVVKGFVAGAGRIGYGVYLDIGIQDPSPKDALFPLHRMRAQLADGESRSAREILDDNALADYMPLSMIVTGLEDEKISVELADATRDRILSWRKYPFDRVIAIGASKDQAENAVRTSALSDDVIEVESLSLFVQSLVCKIGTDAPGVIAKVGTRLRGTVLKAYRAHARL